MKNLILGMPTLIETDRLEECADLCSELGLNFIEINMNLPQYQKDKINVENLKKLISEKNIFFTIHLDENLNVCDFNTDIANAYKDSVLWSIEFAKELNIPVINMHMSKGIYFTLPDQKLYLFDKYRDVYLNTLREFRDTCTKVIGDSEIKICIENCDGYKEFMKEGINLLLESEVFALTLDIGHDYTAGGIDSEFIFTHDKRLNHMHIHDADDKKNHLALGTGKINIENKLRIASKNNCRCVLETKTIAGLRQSVKYIKQLYSK